MTKKDLTLYSSSPLRRLFGVSRFSDIFEEFDNVLKSWNLDMKTFTDLQPKSNFPKLNVWENDSEYRIEIALAGFDKEDVSIELQDNCLCIKADKAFKAIEDRNPEESVGEYGHYLLQEISNRSFRRMLNLPIKVKTDEISCKYENGIVECVLKKQVKIDSSNIVKIDIN